MIEMLQHLAAQFFGESSNPFTYTGAFVLWLVALNVVTGLIMLLSYNPTPDLAIESVRNITNEFYLGKLLRAVHRTSADLLVLALLIHMICMWAKGKYTGARSRIWVAGLVALPLIGIIGWSGYILPWDERAMVLLAWGRDLVYGPDAWPIVGWFSPGSFLALPVFAVTNEADQLLRIFALHVGGALVMFFFAMWHLRNVTPPKIKLPIAMWAGFGLLVIFMAAMLPLETGIESLVAFNPYGDPVSVRVDGILTFPLLFYPVLGGSTLSAIILLVWIGLALVPKLEKVTVTTAVVIESNCVGCRHCLDDCPYGAIRMLPHPDDVKSSRGREISSVIDSNCTACGICVGSCAFDAIELPTLTSDDIVVRIESSLEGTQEKIQETVTRDMYSPFEGIL